MRFAWRWERCIDVIPGGAVGIPPPGHDCDCAWAMGKARAMRASAAKANGARILGSCEEEAVSRSFDGKDAAEKWH